MRRAYVEIDLKRFADNISRYRKLIPENTMIMAVVKADGYGHGAVEIAETAIVNGADYLGVAWVAEAVALREAGIQAPILILSEPTVNVAADIVKLDVAQTVYSLGFAKSLNDAAAELGKKAKVHVKIDTGMGRIGVMINDAPTLISQLFQMENLEIEGIFTHFSMADEKDNPYTNEQLRSFNELVEILSKTGYVFPIVHTANTAATNNFPESHLDMVRIGIGLYENVLKFKSRVAYIKRVVAGRSISYGGTYKTKKETNLATISVGYADGLVRILSNRGSVLIAGKEYPIVGRICMDMTVVDIGEDCYQPGQEVTLIGEDGSSEITVGDVADMAGTIDYEILCGIGKRVNRLYKY